MGQKGVLFGAPDGDGARVVTVKPEEKCEEKKLESMRVQLARKPFLRRQAMNKRLIGSCSTRDV